MKSGKYNAKAIAKLANLQLNQTDLLYVDNQLTVSLDYLQSIQKLPTKNVEPTSQVTGLENVFREDVIEPSLSQEEALKNAPRTHNGYIVVDAVFGE